MRYTFGDCRFDVPSRELTVKGEHVHLSPKAFDLLRILIEKRPTVVSKQELMTALWPNTFVVEANLPVIVGEIRAGLGDRSALTSVIKTHHGIGYSFVADARELPTAVEHRAADVHWTLMVGKRRFPLGNGANRVGRDVENDVALPDASVSRSHARILVSDQHVVVEDLNSKNGTTVNGRRVEGTCAVRDGDEIEFGTIQTRLVFSPPRDLSTLTL
jgi:DNA-binding winged helix-turn-helix (wHTH) protein